MVQTSLEILPESPYAPLATFSWGSNVLRYCRWTSNITVGGEEYQHEPSLKVVWDQPQHGGSEDAPIIVQMKSFIPPFDALSLPFAHAVVSVEVAEASPRDTDDFRVLFSGRIKEVISRPGGQGGITRAKIVGIKSRLDRAVGLQGNSTCPWIFGRSPCGFSLAANSISGTITALSVDGVLNRITVDVNPAHDMQNDRWARGYIQDSDGLRISIRRSFDDDQVTMELRELPPPDWLNRSVLVVPGCNKTIDVCRLHDQEITFNGFGHSAPYYNPTLVMG